ncbi:ABC transporter ATP-binding protein [Mucilaginibacter terrae]|uniref:Peptide/nickel transport system ATP-binding protein n=1 Tax=Mucilaginibacter terrae TaxID=1955052 RepID=A0ABU3GQW3_9SPHI|nr:ABC transporter ATP-binding protein [Mucilaginibacter terrae]MDT3401871.1 peptide/nickel transport system ATP-binding protein [Mucilaginibacter terrae]
MLHVNNLHISFKTANGWFEAVKGISFSIKQGETLGIVGESGSGKSVTSLAIMRLLNEQQARITGDITFDGINITQMPEPDMRALRGNRIAMIFQEPMTSLNPVLTCGVQITEAIRLHRKLSKKEARTEAISLFNEVQLPRAETIFDSYPHQLSGGQRQRVMIAMALSCNPELLIADEPTTALDVTVQKTITDLLLKLQAERNMGLLFISHDLGVVSQVANEVLVMYRGEAVEQGLAKEIFANPQHPYTKGLLACRPSVQKHLKSLPVISDFLKVEADGSLNSTGQGINSIEENNAYSTVEIEHHKQLLYSKQPLLKVNNLCTWFPVNSGWLSSKKEYIKAVNNISFEVYPGETLGLVGESGSGKTTLGRSILRLVEPTSGSIIYKDTDLRKLSSADIRQMRRRMQIIFQDPYSSLNPRQTIGQLLMEPMQVHSLHGNDTQRRQKVMELLQRVNLLPEHFNRYPHEFSGGQRQRVVIARALALEPEFIICDESVSALDVSVQAQILNLLKDLQRDLGLTYIFISHDLSVIKHISDRIMVINKGQIEEIADAQELYLNPKTPYTQKLIASIPQINI